MTEYLFADGSSVALEFNKNSDLSIRLSYNHANGERVSASSFLYGPGKNMPGYATALQNELLYALAPLARSEGTGNKALDDLARDQIVEITMPGPDDTLRITADTLGNIHLYLRGQDMGFREKAHIDIAVIDNSKDKNYPLYQALNHFLRTACP